MYFTVGFSQHKQFPNINETIKFDRIITNVGGGYIDDVTNADYGKFIVPGNGTYQFNAILFSNGPEAGAHLMKNSTIITSAWNALDGSAGLSAILDLTEGDKVYLQRAVWQSGNTVYHEYMNSFSGFLIQKS